MQNNNGVKQRFLDCFLKILDKKRNKWRELLPDQYSFLYRSIRVFMDLKYQYSPQPKGFGEYRF
jgi:hypothetical protein